MICIKLYLGSCLTVRLVFVQFAFSLSNHAVFTYLFIFIFLFIFLAVRKEFFMPQFIGGVIPNLQPALKFAYDKMPDSGLRTTLGQVNSAIKNGFNSFADFLAPHNPLERFKNFAESVPDLVEDAKSSLTASKPSYSLGSSARSVSQATVQPQTVDYLNADLAKHYGLGASTAYQEALSNTAYQRAVKDMKAAGLNPAAIFGSGKGYTAGGVSYVDSDGSNSSGAVGGSGSNEGKLFSSGAYHAISTAVGLAGMVAMKKGPIGYYISETAAKAVLGALNEVFD